MQESCKVHSEEIAVEKCILCYGESAMPQNDYCQELNRQVDLRRETLIQEIHSYSDILIQKIDALKEECTTKSKLKSTVTETIDVCKAKLKELDEMFSTFEINDQKVEEILTQNRSKELQAMLEPIKEEYQRDLLGHKSYELTKKAFEMADVFGALTEVIFHFFSIFKFLILI